MNHPLTIPPDPVVSPLPRYIMIGGFLGAGKTTSVLKLAQHLKDSGLRVGLITNDQGNDLVDTALLRSKGFQTSEISGGCFCCRFNSLLEAADQLTRETTPDVFIAEPVGSCTDLVSTVTYPLRRIYGSRFTIAPLSVVTDPIRAMHIFGLKPGKSFSEKVAYIYKKQLEEADLIVINKIDVLANEEMEQLRMALSENFPAAEVIPVSARTGKGLDDWFEKLQDSVQKERPTMAVDYHYYGEGEALLGWLNATVQLSSKNGFDANDLLKKISSQILRCCQAKHAEIAHLKMTLDPHHPLGELAVINLVRNDFVPELSQELSENAEHGTLIVNCRAEADPNWLRQILEQVVSESNDGNLQLKLTHLEAFKPGQPQPTHKVVVD